MNCLEFSATLEDQVEHGTSADSAELRAHRSECAACRRLWEQMRSLDEAIGAWRSSVPACDVADSVLADFAGERSRNLEVTRFKPQPLPAPRRTRTWLAGLVALAGAVALSLVIPAVWRPNGGQPNNHVVIQPVEGNSVAQRIAISVPTQVAAEDSEVEVRALVHEAGVAYLELAESTASAFRDAADLLPPVSPVTSIESHVPESPITPGTQWIDDLGGGLKPIGSSVSQAFDFLWRTQSERAEG